ncbi:hypothetical protein GEMRC1_010098 [Eukaryota sp. GEM-RC1]
MLPLGIVEYHPPLFTFSFSKCLHEDPFCESHLLKAISLLEFLKLPAAPHCPSSHRPSTVLLDPSTLSDPSLKLPLIVALLECPSTHIPELDFLFSALLYYNEPPSIPLTPSSQLVKCLWLVISSKVFSLINDMDLFDLDLSLFFTSIKDDLSSAHLLPLSPFFLPLLILIKLLEAHISQVFEALVSLPESFNFFSNMIVFCFASVILISKLSDNERVFFESIFDCEPDDCQSPAAIIRSTIKMLLANLFLDKLDLLISFLKKSLDRR